MKYYSVVLSCGLALAQSSTSTYIPGLNGNQQVASTVVANDDQHTELYRSINGQNVPLQQSETHVLRKDANGSVTETIVRRFNQNGQLVSTEKTVTELSSHPGGSSLKATTYATDLSGNQRETERKTVETQTSGATTNTQTVIERPSVDGGLQPVEKRAAVTETNGNSSHQDETVYRPDGNGGFNVAERKVDDTTRSGDKTTEKTALYQPIAEASTLQLSRQQVTTTTAHPDGSETKQVDYYLPSVPGMVRPSDASPQLWEQDTIQRKAATDGSVVETVTARRTDPNNPSQLGSPQRLSETICRGNCSGQ